MITKVIKLKLQYFKHVYVQARPPDKSAYRNIIFFISHPKHMFKLMAKKIIKILRK